MHKLVLAAVTALVMSAPVDAQTGRFAPDNPWFQDFEAACRRGDNLDLECAGSVQDAAESFLGGPAKCDYVAFWKARDTIKAGDEQDLFGVLPWQYGVEGLVERPGVCRLL